MTTISDSMKRRGNAIDTQMSTAIGREFVANMLETMFWGQKVFANEFSALAHNVGVQSSGNDLYSMVEDRQPEQTAMMLQEWRERRDQLVEGKEDD